MADDSNDDTLRHAPTQRGLGPDEGSAETALAGPAPDSPSPSRPPTAKLATRGIAQAGIPSPIEVSTRYAIGQVLGQGGMGEVMLAYDEQIGREVAVKRIRSELPSQEELSRFVREARVQGRLEHPAVVPVHDLAYDGKGRPFFVMKRLTGTDMHELLRQLRTGDEVDEPACRRRLLRAFADICLAVEFAHSRGIIHRDLKPANVMLGDFGEVYVLDWGVARTVTDPDDASAPSGAQHDLALETGETQVGTVLGTPAYMAPEQLVGERAGPAADIYALGCILFEIAANEPLHVRSRSLGAAFQPIDPRPSTRRPDSPPELDAICERAIQLDPDARFESARALGAAVQDFLDGDRDLAVRKELSLLHLTEARAALERGHGELDRRAAMQAAGRALALDPTASAAADLVTHLMLKPPEDVPEEVDRQLAAIDTETARSQARLAAVAVLGYLAFVPFLLWTGVRDLTLIAIFATLAITSGAQVLLLTRRHQVTSGPIYVNACINAVLIGIVCRMVGPFIIAPTLVTTTLMAYASHPRFGRISILALILSSAVVVPWTLELLGVIEPTYHFDGGALVLASSIVKFSSVPTQIAFALLLVSLVGVVGALSRAIATRHRDAMRRLEIQAWHLRQILPAASR
ncbi:MAG: Serine/threonine protein kinase PrkC, regulator of stationary phase [Deltaproteobacteria bacterium]|nr:Serine/threonine protein kinase PrkC, regulator of stationary phase [Deltaproteobacteria bacterium]